MNTNPIVRVKRSLVQGKVPTAEQLGLGEIAINHYDGKVFVRQDTQGVGIGTTVIIANPWSVGPGTSVYNTYFTNGNVGIGTTNPQSKLDVSGDVSIASTVGIGTRIDIVPYDNLNSGTLSFEGSTGQLFSITNTLGDGPIASFNDISGVPCIEVNNDGTVVLVPYNDRVGIGTTNPQSKLDVRGAITVGVGTVGINTIFSTTDIQGWDYQGKFKSVSADDTSPQAVYVGAAGTAMFIVGDTNNRVIQYTLSTPYDVSTAGAAVTFFSTATQETVPTGIDFNPDGTKMFVSGAIGVAPLVAGGDYVHEYSLSTPWNVSPSSVGYTTSYNVTQDTLLNAVIFGNNGSKMYVLGDANNTIFQYSLSTPYSLASGVTYDSISLAVGTLTGETNPYDISINSTGTVLWVTGLINDRIYEFRLSTPWDISTAVFYDDLYIGFNETFQTGLHVIPEQNVAYIVGTSSDTVFQYSTNSPSIELASSGISTLSSIVLNNETRIKDKLYVKGLAHFDDNIVTQGSAQIIENITVSGGTITTGNVAASLLTGNTTTNINFATGQSTGTLTVGGEAQTGTMTVGLSTASQTTNIQSGVNASGTQKTINFGTGGASGSGTLITLGSATAGAISTVTIPSPTNLLIGNDTPTGTASQRLQVNGNAYVSGNLGVGITNPTQRLHILENKASGYAAVFDNDGNNANRFGIRIQCGVDTGAGTAIAIDDGDGTNQGNVTFNAGTVTYGAFTANHDCVIPSYSGEIPYGSLMVVNKILYKKRSDGTEMERGILYEAGISTVPYAKNLLGAYSYEYDESSPVQNGSDLSAHQVLVLGDGHIRCCGESGNIKTGDGITSSSIEGVGMKMNKIGIVIGIAQEDVEFENPTDVKLVPVQYGLHQYIPDNIAEYLEGLMG